MAAEVECNMLFDIYRHIYIYEYNTVTESSMHKRHILSIGTALALSLSANIWAQVATNNNHAQVLTTNGCVPPTTTHAVWGKYVNSMLLKTRTAATYPKDLWVLTLVEMYQDMDHRANPDLKRRVSTTTLWIERGMTDRFQLGVCQPYSFWENSNHQTGIDTSENGPGDTTLYAKGKLVKETACMPTISLDGFLKLPVADKDRGLSNGEVDETLGVELSKRWRSLSLHLNPEYVLTGGSKSDLGATADDRVAFNTGLMWHATPKLIPMAEYNGYWWGNAGELSEVGGGLLWFPTKNTSVKLGVSTPVHKDVTWAADWTPWIKVAFWF